MPVTRPVALRPHACPTCEGRSYVLAREGDRAVARICACAKSCAVCGGRGHVYVKQQEEFSRKMGKKEYDVLAPCSCRLLERRLERFGDAGIPGVLALAGFHTFRAFNEAQDAARRMAMAFAQSYVRGQGAKGFILGGPVGTGKSHLLISALTHLALEVGVGVRYVEISLLYATIRRGFQDGKSGGEIIGPLSEVDLGRADRPPLQRRPDDTIRNQLFVGSRAPWRPQGRQGVRRLRRAGAFGERLEAFARPGRRTDLQPPLRNVPIRAIAAGHARSAKDAAGAADGPAPVCFVGRWRSSSAAGNASVDLAKSGANKIAPLHALEPKIPFHEPLR